MCNSIKSKGYFVRIGTLSDIFVKNDLKAKSIESINLTRHSKTC